VDKCSFHFLKTVIKSVSVISEEMGVLRYLMYSQNSRSMLFLFLRYLIWSGIAKIPEAHSLFHFLKTVIKSASVILEEMGVLIRHLIWSGIAKIPEAHSFHSLKAVLKSASVISEEMGILKHLIFGHA
jgi:hypothetical protein